MVKGMLIFAGIIIAFFAVAAWRLFLRRPNLSQFEFLRMPRITFLPDIRVIEVTAGGDAGTVAAKTIAVLMRTYFKLRGVPRGGPSMPAPRGRWSFGTGSENEVLTGRLAMPVPDTVNELPDIPIPEGITRTLVEWPYGEVAEILHVGSYGAEKPTVARLDAFVAEQGYRRADNWHEEEYLRGPGMLRRGDPAKYLTIIRYRVERLE